MLTAESTVITPAILRATNLYWLNAETKQPTVSTVASTVLVFSTAESSKMAWPTLEPTETHWPAAGSIALVDEASYVDCKVDGEGCAELSVDKSICDY